jgi:YD repeat-containing protein
VSRLLPIALLALLLLAGVSVQAQTSTWTTGTYVYDGSGNIRSIGTTEQYRYDALGRLVTGTVATGGTQTAEYDAFGNITRLTTNAYEQILGVNPATNQVTQTVAPYNAFGTYDAAGRLLAATGDNTFTYDAGDMVTKSTVEGVTKVHLYSASDERVVSITLPNGAEEWTLRDPSGKILRRVERSGSQWTWKQDDIYHGA